MERSGESQLAPEDGERAATGPALAKVVPAGLAIAAGAALRVWMLNTSLFEVYDDSLVYGGIAKNLLLNGSYALSTGAGIAHSTLIRLPGYPLFLALCFRLFGMENYFAACCVQIVVELAGCLFLAAFARRTAMQIRPKDGRFSRRVGLVTLWLGVLCPFTASYAALPMAETLTLFTIALAMWALGRFRDEPGWGSALAFTFAVTYAALLRPDGALVAVAFAPVVLIRLMRNAPHFSAPQRARIAIVCLVLALAPFAAWGCRNWKVFHVFQPLAPRSATDPGERTNPGFERWVKTWSLEYVSTAEIYWYVEGDSLDVNALPDRSFDTREQYESTLALARDYNAHGKRLTDALDARFARLADERIAAHPLRFYLWLPVGRVLDMWLRPRNENLPVALDWWNYARHRGETIFSWFYIALNVAFLLLALAGLWMRPRFWLPLLAYVILRSCLLLTIGAPEARYTLECFPMLFVWGGVGLALLLRQTSGSSSAKPNLQPV
jgi:hypothetical protein